MNIFLKRLIRRFKYSFRGLWYAAGHEQSFRIQLAAALAVTLLMVFFRVKAWEAAILIFSMLIVLVLELINTAAERIIDILKPRIHNYVRDIKDIMASAVLLASAGAAVIGLLIFWPYFFR